MTVSTLRALTIDDARIAETFRAIAAAIPDADTGTVTSVPNGVVIDARRPLGVIAMMCAPDASAHEVAENIAAALAAGNRVAVGLIDAPGRTLTDVFATLTGSLAHTEFWILGDERQGWRQLGRDHVLVAISAAGVRVGDRPRLPHLAENPVELIHRYTRVHRFDVAIDTCVVTRLPHTRSIDSKGSPS